MRIIAPATQRQTAAGLLFLRIVVGLVFVMHGGQKLFVYGLEGVSGGFGQMGIPMAGVIGPAVALVEFLGGLAILLGLFTRVAALGIAIVMVGALAFVKLRNGFFLPNGFEFDLTLLGSALTLMFTGAGGYSLDAVLSRHRLATPASGQPLSRVSA